MKILFENSKKLKNNISSCKKNNENLTIERK